MSAISSDQSPPECRCAIIGSCEICGPSEAYARADVICRQSSCPGSLGGDHDGRCPLFREEVWS